MPERTHRWLPLLAVWLLTACTAGIAPAVTATPEVSARPTSEASPSPVSTSTPAPTPTSSPTPTPDPAALELEVTSCEGGVVLHWSPATHPDFHHYTALRSPSREIATAWPPIAPAVDWGDTYATDPFVTSGVDASILPSSTRWSYRVMAYDAANRVVSASPVRTARLSPVADLGELVASTVDGRTRLRWRRYEGFSGCFSSYRVVDGTNVMRVISDQGTVMFETTALLPGSVHRLRVEAVRGTALGSFVVGQTAVLVYEVPAVDP